MAAPKRFSPSKAQKEALLNKHPECYVCKALGLKDASFAGYGAADIQYDHWKPIGLVGDDQNALLANIRPIHADSDAPSPEDPAYPKSSRRNCHKGKGNKYDGERWVTVAKIISKLDQVRFIEDLIPERSFEDEPSQFQVTVDFETGETSFTEQSLPVQTQTVAGREWRYVSTMVSPHMLWTDEEAQPRKANTKRLREVAEDLLDHPLLTPIICRVSADGRLVVSDGNHRLCGFYLVRPNDAVPVTIWDIPTVTDLLDTLASAHDKLTQQKYQFTDKALKYSGLAEDELNEATKKYGDLASEKLAWQGMTGADVRVRVQGTIDKHLAEGGFRDAWIKAGLTDGSWKFFLGAYCFLGALDRPFDDPSYHRDAEAQNIWDLCEIIDQELITHIPKKPGLEDSLKTKWWAEGHKQLLGALRPSVRDILGLKEAPEKICYTKAWDGTVRSRIRTSMVKWRESPVWRPDVVRTANNEPDVKAVMFANDFSESYFLKD